MFAAAIAGVVTGEGASSITPLDGGDVGALRIDEHTRFVVGSLAKPLTALAALRLIEQGALALGDTLRDVLPELRTRDGLGPTIRIEHLLTHSSGLPAEARAEDTFDRAWPLGELLPLLREFPLLFPPGARSQYSNVGYSVLGLVIERASGMAFERFMAEHVFAPLGMPSASYRIDERTCPGNAPLLQPNELPAGGLVLSALDLSRFLTHLLRVEGDGFISSEARRLLLTPSQYRPLAGVRQQAGVAAHGFFVERRHGMDLAYHTGGRPGYLAYCHVLPECSSACFTLFAGPRAKHAELWQMQLECVRTLIGRDAVEQHGGESEPSFFGYASPVANPPQRHEPLDAELAACAGRYGVLGYYDFNVEVRGRTLWTDYGQLTDLTPVAPYEHVATRYLPGERVRFVMTADASRAAGVYVSMSYHQRLDDPTLLREHRALVAERFGSAHP